MKMKLKKIGSNETELHMDNGEILFFSYETLVAVKKGSNRILRTDKKFSKTTSGHINKFLKRHNALDKLPVYFMPQDYFDCLNQ